MPSEISANSDEFVLIKSELYDLITERKYDIARTRIDSLMESDIADNMHIKLELYDVKGELYHEEKNYDEELKLTNEAIAIEESNLDLYIKEYIRSQYRKGDIYYKTNNYQASYSLLFSTRKLSEQINDSCSFAQYDYRLGMVLYRQGKYEKAKNYFVSSFSYSPSCDPTFINSFRGQEILNNIALCYFKLGRYKEALISYKKAQNYIDKISRRKITSRQLNSIDIARGVVAGNIGKTYLAINDTVQAIPLLNENIKINLRLGFEIKDALTSQIALAEVQLKQRNFKDFNKSIDSILAYVYYADTKSNIIAQVEHLKSDYYALINEPVQSLLHLRNFVNIDDSLKNVQREIDQNDISTAIIGLTNEYQFGLLKNEFKQKNTYINYFIFFIILLSIFVLIILWGFIKNRNKNKSLKKLIEQVQIQSELLELRNKEKDRILSIVAHDLRTPINSVKYLIDELKSNNNTFDKDEFIDLISLSCQASIGLINEILDYSNKITDANKLVKEPLSLKLFLKQTVELIQFKAIEKKQNLKLELPENDFNILINEERFRRAVGNILINAIKFSPRNSNIILTAEKKDKSFVIKVQDSGIGIPVEIEKSIFEAFTKSKREGTDGEVPFGLGLSISKDIIEEHQGTINFESKVGIGTTFFIELPIQ